jgi:nucleotide-binding universal stress UspA family protein
MITFERILCPTDFSDYSAEAISYACALADRFDAELHLLHVLEVRPEATPVFGAGLALPSYSRESRTAAEEKLGHLLAENWQAGKRVVRIATEGTPFLEIIRYAKEHQIDIIVMGTHGRAGLSHIMMGSVAERVVRKSPCPVLTVRPREHKFVMP